MVQKYFSLISSSFFSSRYHSLTSYYKWFSVRLFCISDKNTWLSYLYRQTILLFLTFPANTNRTRCNPSDIDGNCVHIDGFHNSTHRSLSTLCFMNYNFKWATNNHFARLSHSCWNAFWKRALIRIFFTLDIDKSSLILRPRFTLLTEPMPRTNTALLIIWWWVSKKATKWYSTALDL